MGIGITVSAAGEAGRLMPTLGGEGTGFPATETSPAKAFAVAGRSSERSRP